MKNYELKYRCLSLSRIQELINLGKSYENKKALEDGLYSGDFEDLTPEEYKFVSWGCEDKDFEIKEGIFYRIGEPAIDWYGCCYKSSFNHAEDRPEKGISVATKSWLNSLKSVFFGAYERCKTQGVYKIRGIIVGYGGDDEPVIYALDWAEKTRIRSLSGLRKAVFAE